MIHDARVEVTCDAEGCWESVDVEPRFVYQDFSGENGHYDTRDESIKRLLTDKHGWKVEGGKHLCASCAEDD